MRYERVGDTSMAEGDGFSYHQVGCWKVFKQYKKIPSLRRVKVMIKKYDAIKSDVVLVDNGVIKAQ